MGWLTDQWRAWIERVRGLAASQPLFLQCLPGSHERTCWCWPKYQMPYHGISKRQGVWGWGKRGKKTQHLKHFYGDCVLCPASCHHWIPRGFLGPKMLKEIVLDACSALSSAASCPNRKHLSKFSPGPAMASGGSDACLGLPSPSLPCLLTLLEREPFGLAYESLYVVTS